MFRGIINFLFIAPDAGTIKLLNLENVELAEDGRVAG